MARGVVHFFDDLGHGTHDDAEWLGLIRALELSRSLDLSPIDLIGDSAEVVRQANMTLLSGRARHGHAATFLSLVGEAPPRRIRWIKRQHNLAGIALAARHQGNRPCCAADGL